jgi:arylsulfatase A-like enzyme
LEGATTVAQQSKISRRGFVQATAASSLALAGMGYRRPARAQSPKPNIVFILADDLGYADVSCYGQPDYITPNIDRLAIEGLKFTHAYSNSPDCSSTRTALITGRYPARLPVGLEEPLTPLSPRDVGLPPSHPTLPSLLKKVGYGTTLVGKWHLGYLPDFSPLKSGYDHFFGILGCCADYFNHGADASQAYQLPYPGLASQLHEQEVPIERHGYMTNLLGDRAVQTVEGYAKSREPFLLSLHFTAPHWPWEGPDDEAESRRIRSIMDRDGGTQRTYAAMVQSLDANVGRVLQALEASGLANNTIVVFTSDNGGERFSNTWPFSGMKHELLEGGIRIPAIARWPGRIAAGSVSDQVMATMDWLPTLLAAAGTTPDAAYLSDGENLGPVITRDGAASHPRELYWRYKAGSQRAARDGNWKYLRIAGNEFLFDVVRDPRERANLKDREKDVLDRLKARWEGWNGTLLPERTRAATYFHTGNFVADHYGVVNPPPAAPSSLPKD